AGGAHTGRERTGRVVAGVAGLQVDVVVGAGGEDVRPVRVDRHRGLVLLVLRERARGAADAHPRVGLNAAAGSAVDSTNIAVEKSRSDVRLTIAVLLSFGGPWELRETRRTSRGVRATV